MFGKVGGNGICRAANWEVSFKLAGGRPDEWHSLFWLLAVHQSMERTWLSSGIPHPQCGIIYTDMNSTTFKPPFSQT